MFTPTGHPHLIVFGRYPRVGTTKTRLIPALGPAGAAALQKKLTEITVVATRQAATRIGARVMFCHGGGNQKQLRRWLGVKTIHYVPQASGDLGRRMHLAIKQAFANGAGRVVLVGTDIPGMTTDIIEQAVVALNEKDLVLGPSTDGGYWLVGMKGPHNIFEGIAWSTGEVLERTLMLARFKGLTAHLLAPLTDLDTPGDLTREMGHESSPAPYLSVIIPTLNEERCIAETITAAACADAEIIVSDGGSTDFTVETARSLGALVVGGQYDRAAQLNRAAAFAKGETLLFLGADSKLPRNYTDHIFETLIDQRTTVGAFRWSTAVGTPPMRRIARLANLCAGWLILPVIEQGLFMQKHDFDALGGFPDVPMAEDTFLVCLMARKGRIVLSPAAVVASAWWRRLGAIRNLIMRIIITIACLAGVTPNGLAPLGRWRTKRPQP